MKPITFAKEAEVETADAARWYEHRKQGLGSEFLAELGLILDSLTLRPESFARLKDPAADLGIRRALMPRFPYAVVFMALGDGIRVLAVCHLARRPGYWLYRIAP